MRQPWVTRHACDAWPITATCQTSRRCVRRPRAVTWTRCASSLKAVVRGTVARVRTRQPVATSPVSTMHTRTAADGTNRPASRPRPTATPTASPMPSVGAVLPVPKRQRPSSPFPNTMSPKTPFSRPLLAHRRENRCATWFATRRSSIPTLRLKWPRWSANLDVVSPTDSQGTKKTRAESKSGPTGDSSSLWFSFPLESTSVAGKEKKGMKGNRKRIGCLFFFFLKSFSVTICEAVHCVGAFPPGQDSGNPPPPTARENLGRRIRRDRRYFASKPKFQMLQIFFPGVM